MAKPVILAVDDDQIVLNAIERDLRRQYGKEYRIVSADSGAKALEVLKQLKQRNDAVALLLVDQRMPQMTGVEFLEQALTLFPDAKRALLTAYADTEAAIRAINQVRLDYYLMKPWDPPEEHLYPVLQDLLDDWRATFRPPFEGLRVVGHRWSSQAHQIKDFLSRNQIPYQWLDVELEEEARRLVASAGPPAPQLPVVFFPDGSYLPQPAVAQVAEKTGLKTRAALPFYDLVIVGAGPAGLAAAVYGASEGLRTLVIDREAPGGQAGTSSRIENYLGFPAGLSGSDLARRAVAQAAKFGAEILTPQEVTHVRVEGPYRIVTLADGGQVSCHALLVATGVSYRKLDAPGIDALTGVGVYYGAAITEAASCRDKDVFVVGGGNSAGQGAMYLAKYARTVTMLVRGESLAATMSQYLIDQIAATEKIRVWTHCTVASVQGTGGLETVTIANGKTGAQETLPAAALFIFIGAAPRTDWVAEVVERDKYGFILTGPELTRGGRRPRGWTSEREPFFLEASVPGIFVAGDVRSQSIKRVASAVGEGAMAVAFTHQYLANL
ncbi:MAG: FAD-dependent oxidoreductase [Anaerolineae bacterium]|nr:FAD-dependent oxidoreductase [Anaerolineae bacterium]